MDINMSEQSEMSRLRTPNLHTPINNIQIDKLLMKVDMNNSFL